MHRSNNLKQIINKSYGYKINGGIDKRFFESESGSVYNGSGSALNPNPDPCIMGPDPHYF